MHVTDSADAEFDTLAEWTAEVAADLGQEFYIPAGCRGSGSPAVLDWLIDQLDLSAGELLLDCGAGVGSQWGGEGYSWHEGRCYAAQSSMGVGIAKLCVNDAWSQAQRLEGYYCRIAMTMRLVLVPLFVRIETCPPDVWPRSAPCPAIVVRNS